MKSKSLRNQKLNKKVALKSSDTWLTEKRTFLFLRPVICAQEWLTACSVQETTRLQIDQLFQNLIFS
ncbi:MAG: hypothetical protein CW691_10470 [Candidatus Bathyarchaeum sp.]|nr:MAG: hypothetical protein CW691_10470 [Candidatus Bathyarchaeum sp.]